MAEMILVVDDETEIADLVEVYLKNEGYLVKKASCAAEALHIADTQPIALALLDVMLPDLDGFTLCRKIREKHLFPLIMLTAKTEDVDKITGLTLGADDYITKPFNPLEVVARVKTQLRRYIRYNQTAPEPAPAAVYDCGGLYIDHESHTCTLYRLIGLRVEGLEENEMQQTTLFEPWDNEKQEKLDKVVDELKIKYGYNFITRAGRLDVKDLKFKGKE